MSKILQIACAELGVKEIPGSDHNELILAYAHEAGFEWVNDDETPWCSIFVNWVAKKAGYIQSKNAAARSWLTIGQNVAQPEPGDLVIFWREHLDSWKGHVGFFLGFDSTLERIYVLGGNQGNQVSITAYSEEQLLGFRKLKPSGDRELPEPILQNGNTGEEVVKLQDILKELGFDCGTSDGIFGPKTEAALKAFQSTDRSMEIDGRYGEEEKDFLNNQIN